MSFRRTWWLGAWLLLGVTGCLTSEAPRGAGLPADLGSQPDRVCDPGRTSACSCTDGRAGAQECAADGTRWLTCGCTGTGEPEGVAPGEGEGEAEGLPEGEGAGGEGEGEGGEGEGEGGEGEGEGREGEGEGAAVGTFLVNLVPPVPGEEGNPAIPGFTSLVGRVYDGPVPSQLLWETTGRSGDCRLVEPVVPVCEPACVGGTICADDDRCLGFPAARSVGQVTVQGMRNQAGETEFTVEPLAGTYQYASCPFPAFAEGDELRLDAAGGELQPFSLRATGIAPLEFQANTPVVQAGQPLRLTWLAGAPRAAARIQVRLDLSHHGGLKGLIECETEDSGTLELPRELVDRLLALGVAGFPSVVVTRRSVGRTELDWGRVELQVVSAVERFVEIPGLVSCNSHDDCPTGQICEADLTCAVGSEGEGEALEGEGEALEGEGEGTEGEGEGTEGEGEGEGSEGEGAEGEGEGCQPQPETCDNRDEDCDGLVDEELVQACAVASPHGTCTGQETCGGGRWAGCTAASPTAESCDGHDNDCDGQTDEELVRGCSRSNPHGTCPGAQQCGAGQWLLCDAATPAAEECNGLDDDCDGGSDEGLEQACAIRNALGACWGVQRCAAGDWSPCDAATPELEVCDGLDNNCDGAVDEGCTCQPGSQVGCYNGVPSTRQVGNCTDGLATCEEGRAWGECLGEVLPQLETCDGQDEDCDGAIDEELTQACAVANGFGSCTGTAACQAGQWVGCTAATPAAEACDGVDNDCDGTVDEALSQACTVSNGLGTCRGTETCESGRWVGCTAATPAAEACDGVDNDCDGVADEALSRPCAVSNGFGTCTGTETCRAGGWIGCTAATPAAEACDGVDNDCDGLADETCLPPFSFFVTSMNSLIQLSGNASGFGGDLRYGEEGLGAGLRGADKICAEIAELSMPGAAAKQWRAFLCAAQGENGQPVHAIDRIGNGPWYDRLGRIVALNKAALLHTRPQGADPAIINDLPNEFGVPNHQPDPTQPPVDNHDTLTGCNTSGRLYNNTATCLSWTAKAGNRQLEGRPRVGHTWPRGGGWDPMAHWISCLDESGCAPGINLIDDGPPDLRETTVGSGGGYGGFYCFALTP